LSCKWAGRCSNPRPRSDGVPCFRGQSTPRRGIKGFGSRESMPPDHLSYQPNKKGQASRDAWPQKAPSRKDRHHKRNGYKDSAAGWPALLCPAICSNLKLDAERIIVPPILPSKAVLGHVSRGRTKYRRESDAKVRRYSRILERESVIWVPGRRLSQLGAQAGRAFL